MAYGLFAARHHLHPQRGADLRLRDPGDLDGTAQSGLPFELKIADLTQDGAHAKCATKPLTGARYHDTATGWGLYLLFIMPIGSCPGRATGCTCSCLARKARAGYAFFPPSHFRHFAYFCAADFTDKRGWVLASVRRALPYAECHKAVGLGTRMGERYFASTGMSALALSIFNFQFSIFNSQFSIAPY